MDEDKIKGINRSVSLARRMSMLGGTPVNPKWFRILFVVVVLFLGILCGHFVYKLIFSTQYIDRQYNTMKRQNIHKQLYFRNEIKKKGNTSDLVHDYLPRNIFITTGNWTNQRNSLHLFLQTFPEASTYDLYCFLEETSYGVFFKPFNKTTIIHSKVVSHVNKTIPKVVSRFGNKDIRKNKTHIDFGAWLIDTFHQDDYIVVRMESVNETAIAKRLDSIGAFEWIDKFYTTSGNNETLSVYLEAIKDFHTELFFWDDESLTYSDFDILNKVDDFKDTTSIMTQCGYYEQFLLVMYVPCLSVQALYSLEVLKSFAGPRFLESVVFVSREIIIQHPKLIESLIQVINVGMLMENKTYSETPMIYQYNEIRNDFIEVNRKLKDLETRQINIHYALTFDFNEDIKNRLCEERHVNIIDDVLNIGHFIPVFVKNIALDFKKIKRKHGQILSLDLTEDNSDLLMVYLLKKYGSGMTAIKSCEY